MGVCSDEIILRRLRRGRTGGVFSVRRRGGLFSAACRVVARLGRLGEEESGTFTEFALMVPSVLLGSAFAFFLSLGFGLGLGGATGSCWPLGAGV